MITNRKFTLTFLNNLLHINVLKYPKTLSFLFSLDGLSSWTYKTGGNGPIQNCNALWIFVIVRFGSLWTLGYLRKTYGSNSVVLNRASNKKHNSCIVRKQLLDGLLMYLVFFFRDTFEVGIFKIRWWILLPCFPIKLILLAHFGNMWIELRRFVYGRNVEHSIQFFSYVCVSMLEGLWPKHSILQRNQRF
jgi:hypothetical protein